MGRFGRSLSLILCFALIGTTSSFSLAETNRSLYERLGGYDAISAVVDAFPKSMGGIRSSDVILWAWAQIPGTN